MSARRWILACLAGLALVAGAVAVVVSSPGSDPEGVAGMATFQGASPAASDPPSAPTAPPTPAPAIRTHGSDVGELEPVEVRRAEEDLEGAATGSAKAEAVVRAPDEGRSPVAAPRTAGSEGTKGASSSQERRGQPQGAGAVPPAPTFAPEPPTPGPSPSPTEPTSEPTAHPTPEPTEPGEPTTQPTPEPTAEPEPSPLEPANPGGDTVDEDVIAVPAPTRRSNAMSATDPTAETVPTDTAMVLVVDPGALPAGLVAELTRPNEHGVTRARVYATEGDGYFHPAELTEQVSSDFLAEVIAAWSTDGDV